MLTASSFVDRVWQSQRAAQGAGRGAQTREIATWTGDDVIDWITHKFYIPEMIGEADPPAMPLADYQQAVLREAHRRNPIDHTFIYDFVLWSDIKKSIKSSIAAAVMLFRALHTSYFSGKVVANDQKQADSRVFFYITRAIELNPELASQCIVKNHLVTLPNRHSTIEAIPVDPKGEAGGNDDLIEWTELHAATSKAAQELWSEMTLSPTKYGYSQRWADTYAGHSGESPILEPLYETGVKSGRRLELPDAPVDLELYANGSMLVLWNTRPRCSWQLGAKGYRYYANEAQTLLPNEYARMHGNEWTTSSDVFVQAVLWNNCRGELPSLTKTIPLVLSMDAGISNDCFAVVGVTRIGGIVYVLFVFVWRPQPGQPIDFAEPEKKIRELCSQYNVVQICYDPYQLHDMAMRLRRDGVAWLYEFTQMKPRLEADKALRDAILQRLIVHDGNPILTEHVCNANAKVPDGDIDKLRIVKRADHLKIDACVALSMANSEARRLQIG